MTMALLISSTGVVLPVWHAFSLALAAALAVLGLIAERFVLAGIDVSEEVDRQQNIGVATTEVAIYIAIGLLMAGLLG